MPADVPKLIGEGVEFTCPFCQTHACKAYKNAVMHPIVKPMCLKYLMLEPDEFLRAVNDAFLLS